MTILGELELHTAASGVAVSEQAGTYIQARNTNTVLFVIDEKITFSKDTVQNIVETYGHYTALQATASSFQVAPRSLCSKTIYVSQGGSVHF